MPSRDKPLAVSIGEPAGIGPDIVLKAWNAAQKGTIEPLPPLVLTCDPDHLNTRANLLELTTNGLTVDALSARLKGGPAQPDTSDADGIVESIDRCVGMVRDGAARALVTLPINKKSLYDAGFDYPGHTEYLGALARTFPDCDGRTRAVMMLAGPDLRAVPVTIHIPLRSVADALRHEDIVETARIVDRDLRERFRIEAPRIAVSGLNPHAGEGGALGTEDESIIAPAIAQLCAEGIDATGPYPADTMFHPAARAGYDAALCMYHDQALIPAKALAFDETVNVTLGLPFVRTSPDHGTAFDIAGKGIATPASMIEAIRLAHKMAQAA